MLLSGLFVRFTSEAFTSLCRTSRWLVKGQDKPVVVMGGCAAAFSLGVYLHPISFCALSLRSKTKYRQNKTPLWLLHLAVWPLQQFNQTDKLLRFGGTLILKSSLFPSDAFCQLGAVAAWVCQEHIFKLPCLSAYDLCFYFSLCLVLCCPWCCTVWLRVYIPLEYSVGLSHLVPSVKGIMHTNAQNNHKAGSDIHLFDLCVLTHTTYTVHKEQRENLQRLTALGDKKIRWAFVPHLLVFDSVLPFSSHSHFISPLMLHEITLISASPRDTCGIISPV